MFVIFLADSQRWIEGLVHSFQWMKINLKISHRWCLYAAMQGWQLQVAFLSFENKESHWNAGFIFTIPILQSWQQNYGTSFKVKLTECRNIFLADKLQMWLLLFNSISSLKHTCFLLPVVVLLPGFCLLKFFLARGCCTTIKSYELKTIYSSEEMYSI